MKQLFLKAIPLNHYIHIYILILKTNTRWETGFNFRKMFLCMMPGGEKFSQFHQLSVTTNVLEVF